jgi:hypothetical protein
MADKKEKFILVQRNKSGVVLKGASTRTARGVIDQGHLAKKLSRLKYAKFNFPFCGSPIDSYPA